MDVEYSHKIVLIAELSGHDDRTWHVSWNPAKSLLATCSADKSVRLYSYTAGPSPSFALHTSIPTGHTKTVRSVAWSPSGSTLATASFDANIGIWQRDAQEEGDENAADEWECVSILEGHETECKSVAWSASGTFLASCSRDKTVWVWEGAQLHLMVSTLLTPKLAQPDADFECMGVLMEHTQDVKCVAWHPREEILASASYDDTIKLYLDDPSEDWFCFATLTGHASTVWSLAWAPNGRYLASASDDRTVRIWKRITEHEWECVVVLEQHERTVYSVTWETGKPGTMEGGSESLGWVASTGSDGTVNVWAFEEPPDSTERSPPKHTLIARLEGAHGVNDVNSIAWCPRKGYEDLIATVGDDGMTKVWKIVPV